MNIKRRLRRIKRFFIGLCRMFDRYSEKSDTDSPPPKDRIDHNEYHSTHSRKKTKREKDRKRSSKIVSVGLIATSILGLPLLCGCSKCQDVKIVHNYWDKTPSFAEKKQQAYIDMYVYKKFKDKSGKESITVYKAD